MSVYISPQERPASYITTTTKIMKCNNDKILLSTRSVYIQGSPVVPVMPFIANLFAQYHPTMITHCISLSISSVFTCNQSQPISVFLNLVIFEGRGQFLCQMSPILIFLMFPQDQITHQSIKLEYSDVLEYNVGKYGMMIIFSFH